MEKNLYMRLEADFSLGYEARVGSLAQLVERFVYTEDVGSSSLSRPTISLDKILKSGSFNLLRRLLRRRFRTTSYVLRALPEIGESPI